MNARKLSPDERAALLNPQYMTPEQVSDLVARAKANESRTRIEGFAKQAASCRATWAARRRAR